MTNITKKQKCLKMRDGIELWIDEEKCEKLESDLLQNKLQRFLKIEGQIISIADITGIYTVEQMETFTRRKNGEWQCSYGIWHKRGEECACGFFEKTKNKDEEIKNVEYEKGISYEDFKEIRKNIIKKIT